MQLGCAVLALRCMVVGHACPDSSLLTWVLLCIDQCIIGSCLLFCAHTAAFVGWKQGVFVHLRDGIEFVWWGLTLTACALAPCVLTVVMKGPFQHRRVFWCMCRACCNGVCKCAEVSPPSTAAALGVQYILCFQLPLSGAALMHHMLHNYAMCAAWWCCSDVPHVAVAA